MAMQTIENLRQSAVRQFVQSLYFYGYWYTKFCLANIDVLQLKGSLDVTEFCIFKQK